MITLKEMLAEPQTMYDGGMVQHMAEGGEPEIKFQEGQPIEIEGIKFPSLVTAEGTSPKKLYRYVSPQEWKEIIETGELSPSNFYERTHASASPEKGYSEKGSILLEIEYSPEDAWYSKIGGGDKVYGVTQKKIPVSRITNIGEPKSNLPVPTEEGESLVGDIVKYAGKVGRQVGKLATKRVPGVGLISSSPAGEGSARYTPEEMGMKLSAQRGIGETPTRAEQVEIRGGPLSKKLNEIQIGRILDDHNIDWEYHEEGGVTAVEKFSRGPDRKKYFRNNTSLKTIRNWLGYYKGGQVRPMYDGGIVPSSTKPMYDGGLV